jgi:hypothetical protein
VKQLLTALMLGNVAIFVFGALQHAGVAIGSFREPVIIPATIVELFCALALTWGVVSMLKGSLRAWRTVMLGNLIAIAGVTVGMVALAVGAGPRTASNDLYHRIMLALATLSLIILFVPATRTALGRAR